MLKYHIYGSGAPYRCAARTPCPQRCAAQRETLSARGGGAAPRLNALLVALPEWDSATPGSLEYMERAIE
jgi:hypothetical protein